MKWLFFLVVVFAGMDLLFQPVVIAETEMPVGIVSISVVKESDGKETISFKLDAFAKTKIFSMGGESPRLVIDFPNSLYAGENVLPLDDGRLATSIRTGMHNEPIQKTRVVVDLSKEIKVHFSHSFSDEDNTMVVTLSSEKIEQPPEAGTDKKEQEKQVIPSSEAVKEQAIDEKPVSPVFAVKELVQEPDNKSVPVAEPPQLLKISFDDSSNRGEMVLFRLNDFYPPTVSAIEKETPRVLCDFMDMQMVEGVEENMVANGKYVKRIRAARHKNPNKVRVVLDLSPDRDYDLQQIFFKNDNLFVLIVNELSAEKVIE
jgi:hypothetical protein